MADRKRTQTKKKKSRDFGLRIVVFIFIGFVIASVVLSTFSH